METPCFLEQDVYDKKLEDGEVGMYESRPNCDGNGDYMARKCLPGGRYMPKFNKLIIIYPF